jgi:hypothetical protein
LDPLFEFCSQTPFWCLSSVHDFMTFLVLASDLERRIRALHSGIPSLMIGPELRIFKLNRPGTEYGRPAPFADPRSLDTLPRHGFGIGGAQWLCDRRGDEARACAIGYDFGHGNAKSVRTIKMGWYKRETTPQTVAVEYSDNKLEWAKVGSFPTEWRPRVSRMAPGTIQSVKISDFGKHRYWRIRPDEIMAGASFGVGALSFSDRLQRAAE